MGKIYRLRHKLTGLYLNRENLTPNGKIYSTRNNPVNYNGNQPFRVFITGAQFLKLGYHTVSDIKNAGYHITRQWCEDTLPIDSWHSFQLMVQPSDFEYEYLVPVNETVAKVTEWVSDRYPSFTPEDAEALSDYCMSILK